MGKNTWHYVITQTKQPLHSRKQFRSQVLSTPIVKPENLRRYEPINEYTGSSAVSVFTAATVSQILLSTYVLLHKGPNGGFCQFKFVKSFPSYKMFFWMVQDAFYSHGATTRQVHLTIRSSPEVSTTPLIGKEKIGVLLLNPGVETLDDVQPFLLTFLLNQISFDCQDCFVSTKACGTIHICYQIPKEQRRICFNWWWFSSKAYN